MWTIAIAVTARSLLTYLETIAAYCLMAPFKSPSTVSLRIAACRSMSCCFFCCAAALPASRTAAAMNPVSARFIVVDSIRAIYRSSVRPLRRDGDVCVSFSCLEPVADSAHAYDAAGLCGIGFNFAAQLNYVRVHDSIRQEYIAAPYFVDHL